MAAGPSTAPQVVPATVVTKPVEALSFLIRQVLASAMKTSPLGATATPARPEKVESRAGPLVLPVWPGIPVRTEVTEATGGGGV